MDTKALRQKILDLAIHGKLVPQDPNDEPASVLLERIKAEKERLIKEGKIKRSKKSAKSSDTPHYENVPFEVPSSWVWTNIEELFFVTKLAGFEYTDCLTKDTISSNNEVPIVRAQNVRMGYFVENTNEAISEALSQQLERSALTKKCLLMTFIGAGIGDTCIFPALKRCHLAPNVAKIEPYSNKIDLKYALYYLMSDLGQLGVRGISKSTAQPSLSMATIRSLEIALPPLAEQHRIVAEIEKLFELIDQIEQGKADLQTIIKQTKSKILDLAIHGKLVPQDPNDEPAIELLKRINPDFTPCDNGHYTQLPDGWCVVTLKDLCENINGLWKGKKEPFVNVGVIRNANFTKDFKLDYSNIEYIDVEQRTFAKRHLENGDLIVEKSGGSDNNPVGRTILYEGKSGVFSFSNFTMALRTRNNDIVLSKFLYYYILAKYQKGDMRLMQTQTTGLRNLILDKFLSMPIHLPPLSEQKRIIDRIETIFTSLDMIMGSL